MNHDDAKSILLLYRHGTADADDPQIAEALALAESDPELKDWLVIHCAREFVLREKFRRIAAPAGLKEQIISEQAAGKKIVPLPHRKIKLVFALAAMFLLFALPAMIWFGKPHGQNDTDTLAVYQRQMAATALRGYGMDLTTNDATAMRAYLAQNHAPADFVLPEKLKQTRLAGCAIEGWQDVKVSMICFRSSQAGTGVASDTWLFVIDRAAVKKSTAGPAPQFARVNRLMTATWIQGDKLYFLGTAGDAQTIRQYL